MPKTLRLDRGRFFRSIGYRPHAGQSAVHASQARRRVLACGVRWGKSTCSAMEALAAAMEPARMSRGWVVAPSYELADKVFREIMLAAHEHLRERIVRAQPHLYSMVLRNLSGGISEIRGKSADNPTSLLGEGLDWCVVDEAARLKPKVWDSYLSQRLLDKKGWALLISTPKGKGWFYHQWRAGSSDEDYEAWNSPSWDNPHLDRADIERERERIPDRVFMQEYGAQFIEGAGSVFRNVQENATGRWEDPVDGARYVFGLDLARIEDFTVLVILRVPTSEGRVQEGGLFDVVHVDRFRGVDWSVQVARLASTLARYGNPHGLVDSTGVGDPVLEQLRMGGVNANPYRFTAQSKAELVNNAVLMLEQGRIRLPSPSVWPEGLEELEAFEYSVSDAGNVKMMAPPGIHDDCVMALCLAALEAKKFSPMEVLWL